MIITTCQKQTLSYPLLAQSSSRSLPKCLLHPPPAANRHALWLLAGISHFNSENNHPISRTDISKSTVIWKQMCSQNILKISDLRIVENRGNRAEKAQKEGVEIVASLAMESAQLRQLRERESALRAELQDARRTNFGCQVIKSHKSAQK